MMQSRRYQERAIGAVETEWSQGARSVLLVAPTAAGKTYLATRLMKRRRTLWVAHRRELVRQAAQDLRELFGAENVGLVMAGEATTPSAPIQVGTVHSLLAAGLLYDAELVVFDEAHHFVAEYFRLLVAAYPRALILGLTATPERADGKPLGDIFERMVVAAHYSELLAGGYIVPVRVFRPERYIGSDLAQEPVDAWLQHGENGLTFAFFSRVAEALRARDRWRSRGVKAENIECATATSWRDMALEMFSMRAVTVLTSVDTLTEGVNVPEARVAVSCRAFDHVAGMLQAFGRVLRASPGKADAIIIDLTGATWRHGLPTDDREYSLTGRAISTREGPPRVIEEERMMFSQEVIGLPLIMTSTRAHTERASPAPQARETSYFDLDRVKKIASKHGKSAAIAAAERYRKMGG
jgi:DNA repair protein RadD